MPDATARFELHAGTCARKLNMMSAAQIVHVTVVAIEFVIDTWMQQLGTSVIVSRNGSSVTKNSSRAISNFSFYLLLSAPDCNLITEHKAAIYIWHKAPLANRYYLAAIIPWLISFSPSLIIRTLSRSLPPLRRARVVNTPAGVFTLVLHKILSPEAYRAVCKGLL